MEFKKRALISVSDKEGLEPLAKALIDKDYEILSTGGTAKALRAMGLSIKDVSEVTGFPEIMDGRVKTLHPHIHAGLLADRKKESHLQVLKTLEILPISFVCVNLYPFEETIKKGGITQAECIENIDIGGPSMLRSAAKNFESITVVTDKNDYEKAIAYLDVNNSDALAFRAYLAAKVFERTSSYDACIASYLKNLNEVSENPTSKEDFSEDLNCSFKKIKSLRYGENPHQLAAFYENTKETISSFNLCKAYQHQGKELSYNNIQDSNAALELLAEFQDDPCVIALKHMNPCGVGFGNTVLEAFEAARDADPISIFGGIIASNQTIDFDTALAMSKIFLEVIIAPSFTEEALEVLGKKKNLRLLSVSMHEKPALKTLKLTSVMGGLLVQEQDLESVDKSKCKVVTEKAPTEKEYKALLRAFKIVKHTKSNAIVIFKDQASLGIGPGQSNRVGSAEIALNMANPDALKGAVLASDAFFPFADTVQKAINAGITAIIQPGGSIRDQDSIDACNKAGVSMVFTGIRHFKH